MKATLAGAKTGVDIRTAKEFLKKDAGRFKSKKKRKSIRGKKTQSLRD